MCAHTGSEVNGVKRVSIGFATPCDATAAEAGVLAADTTMLEVKVAGSSSQKRRRTKALDQDDLARSRLRASEGGGVPTRAS